MARRLTLGKVCLGLFLACSPNPSPVSLVETARPNIIVFLADDLGWGDLALHGATTRTPNLDRLATEGVILNQAYVQPLCTPTRLALLSGQSAMRHGFAYRPIRPWDERGVPQDVSLLPEQLQEQGYATALVGKWHLGHASPTTHPNQRGFDHFFGFLTGAGDYWSHSRGNAPDWQRNGQTLIEEGYATDLFAAEAVRWIEQQSADRPFFLELAFSAPHTPVQAPDSLVRQYFNPGVGKKQATYQAMVDSMDQAIGAVLAALQKNGAAENTLVLFLSDNGASLAEGGNNGPFRGGKGTTFEGGIRSPGLLRWPAALPTGVTNNTPIQVEDWAPTLLAVAGVDEAMLQQKTGAWDGVNLLPILLGKEAPQERSLFFAAQSELGLFHAVRQGPWKYVNRILPNGKERQFLFHLDRDPNEKENLAKRKPETLAKLASLVLDWREQSPSPAPHKLVTSAPAGWTPPLDWGARSQSLDANSPVSNIVVFLADDLGTGDLGFLGGQMVTPNLDQLAAQGRSFDRFYSWPLCSPARAALLTGQDPLDLGLGLRPLRPDDNRGIPKGVPTIASRLQDAGWATACIGKWHLGHSKKEQRPNQQGFQYFYGCLQGAVDYETHLARDGSLDWWRNEAPSKDEGYATHLLAQEAVRFLQEGDPKQPFFLYLPFTAPHLPLQAPVDGIRRHMEIEDPARRVFCAMVEEMDSAIGQVLAAIEARGATRDTLVLFLSDNGARTEDGGSNGQLRGGKGSIFEGGIRVPCILRWPGKTQAGSREARPQHIGNVAATLLQAVGLAQDSSATTLLGPAKDAFRLVTSTEAWQSEAWIDGDRKTILRRRKADGFEKRLEFQLDRDPNETKNLAEQP